MSFLIRLILVILNLVAAAGFGFMLLLHHGKQQGAAYAVFQYQRAEDGLPLDQQYVDPTLPRSLYLAHRADDSTSAALREQFQNAGQPVSSQREELVRLQKLFFNTLHGAAKKTVEDAKGEAAKLALLRTVLFPLAMTGTQWTKYQEKVTAAQTDKATADAKLGALLQDAAQRRMLAQALLPLEELRPGGQRDLLALAIADLDKPYADLEKLLQSRFEELLRYQPEEPALKDNKKDGKGAALILELVTVKPPAPCRVKYQRDARNRKVSVALIKRDSTAEAVISVSSVSLKLTNVEGQPQVELAKEGTAYTGTDGALGSEGVLAGEIILNTGSNPVVCYFIERDPADQRQAIAYFLFTLSQVVKPAGLAKPDEPAAKLLADLLPEKRVEVVVGRKRFNQAVELQALVFQQIAERRAPEKDRDLEFFAERYAREVRERIPSLISEISHFKARQKNLETELQQQKDILADRKKFATAILGKVQEDRKKATEALAELKTWQERLFLAQRAGAGVGEENQRLEKLIRELERGR